jgi:hypothetical protein
VYAGRKRGRTHIGWTFPITRQYLIKYSSRLVTETETPAESLKTCHDTPQAVWWITCCPRRVEGKTRRFDACWIKGRRLAETGWAGVRCILLPLEVTLTW